MRLNSFTRLAVCIAFLSGTVFAVPPPEAAPQASTSVATPPSTNVQDYAQGFRAFLKMGLPDTSKATYVKLESADGMQDQAMISGLYEVQLSGNAWLVSENKDDKSVLVTLSGRTLNLLDQKTFMKKQEAEARTNAAARASGGARVHFGGRMRARGLGAETGTWTPVDLSRDLAKATAFVDKKIAAKSAGGRNMRYDSFARTDGPAGALFLLATYAWQNGKTNEANLLVNRLFTMLGDSRKVIVGGLNIMADSQLSSAGDTFRRTRDWNAYAAEVGSLVKKYPTGWRQAGAAKLLAERLQARAAMKEGPALAGEGLGDEDRQLAAALVTETNAPVMMMNMWGGQLWVLPPQKSARFMMGPSAKDESTIGRIVARGVKSLPLLIALASDETLCLLGRNDVGMGSHQVHYSSGDSGQSDEDRIRAIYDQMDRPLTRGEIARMLLTPLCRRDPGSDDGMPGAGDGTAERIVEGVKPLYAEIKSLEPAALPRYFLEKGDANQKQAAVGYMLQDNVESNAAVIEAYLLTPPSDDPHNMMLYMGGGLAQQYVQKRGEKAAEFVEKYAALRQKVELPAGMADNEDYVKEMKKQAAREIKTLRALVKKQDLSKAIADLAGAGDENEAMMMAYTTLSRQKPSVAIPAMLAIAVKTTNLTVRARVLQQMPAMRYSGMEETMESGDFSGTEEEVEAAMNDLANKNKLNIGTNAAEWKILLADTRAMPGQNWYGAGAGEWTIGDLAASSIETLYGDMKAMEKYARMSGVDSVRPESMLKITRARAIARLEGKAEEDLPKYPSADDVTADRRKAIEADAVKASPAEMKALLAKLTDAETMYFGELQGENPAVRKAMAPLSRIIGTVKTPADLPAEDAARLRKLEGTAVSTNALAEMRELCKRQLIAGKAVAVSLSSAGLGSGLKLEVKAMDSATQRMYGGGYEHMFRSMGGGRKGMVSGALHSGHNYGSGMWIVDLPALAATGGATGVVAGVTGAVAVVSAPDEDASDRIESFSSHFESQQEQFETASETFCKPDEPLAGSVGVTFTGMLPADKKDEKKKEKPASDDEEDDDGEDTMDEGMIIE